MSLLLLSTLNIFSTSPFLDVSLSSRGLQFHVGAMLHLIRNTENRLRLKLQLWRSGGKFCIYDITIMVIPVECP